MKSTLAHKFSHALALAATAAFVGCATQEAQQPAPVPAPAPQPAPAPAPAAKPAPEAPKPAAAPAKPAVLSIKSVELFEFNKATLTPAARDLLAKQVVARMWELASIRDINVNGHADRLGTSEYNQKLSDARAQAVRHYLVSRGMEAGRVETFSYGKTLPVKSCPDDKNRAALIACLEPNRRVEVEIEGIRKP